MKTPKRTVKITVAQRNAAGLLILAIWIVVAPLLVHWFKNVGLEMNAFITLLVAVIAWIPASIIYCFCFAIFCVLRRKWRGEKNVFEAPYF